MIKLTKKLAKLPATPGVYFYKDASGEIIYIGKAANLRSRVKQYFQKSRSRDPKTDVLISEIVSLEWTKVESEADALFLEAELVRRYLPRFNILLRDDKSLQYVRVDYKSDYPTVKLVRRPLDDGAQYFGPYTNSLSIRKALHYLRRAFPYATARPINQRRAGLHYHLGLDPGLEEGKTKLSDYRANLRKLMSYLRGQRQALVREIEHDMKRAARAKDFEKAAILRNQMFALQQLNRQILFSDHDLQDANRDRALVELAGLIGLPKPPKRIEGFDISHQQGTDNVASMVVFAAGLPDKASYRKFKMVRPGNDDFAHMAEAVSRRLRASHVKKWGLLPNLVLIDGGKGQLAAAMVARDQAGYPNIPMIGLAKRFEDIIILKDGQFQTLSLPASSHVVKLLQRIRDESHRFALSYHSSLKRRRQTTSWLDEVPGIGVATRKKLIRAFGSARGVAAASPKQLEQVLGPKLGARLASHIVGLK